MTIADRVLSTFYTTGVPFYTSQGIRTVCSEDTTTGADIVQSIDMAMQQVRKLEFCIERMKEVLNGETADERLARIQAEDANPEEAARRFGWHTIDSFAALLDGAPFTKWMGKGQRIIKPNRPMAWYLDPSKPTYPERHQFWADHFDFAESWADALKQERTAQRKAADKRRQEGLGC